MDIVCRLLGHAADLSAIIWNDGLSHSRCTRCGAHLIRRTQRWRGVPDGYRVVWRLPEAGDTVWFNSPKGWNRMSAVPPPGDAEHLHKLPILVRADGVGDSVGAAN